MKSSLILPTGLRQRDVVNLNPLQVKALILCADSLAPLGIDLVCGRCQSACRGTNSGHELTLHMHCRCREFVGANPLTNPS